MQTSIGDVLRVAAILGAAWVVMFATRGRSASLRRVVLVAALAAALVVPLLSQAQNLTFAAGLGDTKIVTTLCPGGKERMRRLMDVVASGRIDLRPMVTHRFPLDRIEEAYDLFSHQRDGVLKIAITI